MVPWERYGRADVYTLYNYIISRHLCLQLAIELPPAVKASANLLQRLFFLIEPDGETAAIGHINIEPGGPGYFSDCSFIVITNTVGICTIRKNGSRVIACP